MNDSGVGTLQSPWGRHLQDLCSLLARFYLQASIIPLGCEGWHRLGGVLQLVVVFVGG
jgi:hypothetical protein